MSAGVPQASVAAVSRFANRATFSSRVRLRTHFVVGVGTGETLTGAGRRLKEHDPRIKIASIVPEILPGIEGLKPVGRLSRECQRRTADRPARSAAARGEPTLAIVKRP